VLNYKVDFAIVKCMIQSSEVCKRIHAVFTSLPYSVIHRLGISNTPNQVNTTHQIMRNVLSTQSVRMRPTCAHRLHSSALGPCGQLTENHDQVLNSLAATSIIIRQITKHTQTAVSIPSYCSVEPGSFRQKIERLSCNRLWNRNL